MSKKGVDEIVVLLDTSGSMADQVKDVQGAFASFVKDQRSVPDRTATLTLWTFNSPGRLKAFWENLDLDKVGVLELKPSGNTALLDAVCETIDLTGERLSRLSEESRPEKVIFLIITDGEENSSTKFSRADVLRRIEHQQSAYKWIFHFVGPDPKLFQEQIPVAQTQVYKGGQHTNSTYMATSGSIRSSRIR